MKAMLISAGFAALIVLGAGCAHDTADGDKMACCAKKDTKAAAEKCEMCDMKGKTTPTTMPTTKPDDHAAHH